MQEQVDAEHAGHWSATKAHRASRTSGTVVRDQLRVDQAPCVPDRELDRRDVQRCPDRLRRGRSTCRSRLDTHSGGFCEALDAVGCQDVFAEAYDRLLNRQPPGIVVMSGTWDLGSFGGGLTERRNWPTDMTATITALHEVGHHVLIVLAHAPVLLRRRGRTFVPAPLDTGEREPHATVWRPENCPSSIAQSDPAACGATLIESDVEATQELTIATLRQLAEDTGASTLFLRSRYCDDGICATNDGNYWMFEDGIHISPGESETLIPTFTRVLQDIIERRTPEGQFEPGEYVYLDSDIAA